MVKAKHHPFIYPFFKWFAVRLLKHNFSSIEIIGKVNSQNKSVLLVANHIGWWDGFWAMYLNLKVFNKKFHFMMLEENLKKHWYFNYSGGFSVKKNSKSMLESIDYSCKLLKNPENLVLLYPSGKLLSSYNTNIQFEKGAERIIKNVNKDSVVVMLCAIYDYWNQKKPALKLYIKELVTPNEAEKEYQEFYIACMQLQLKQSL
ncbi:MAG: 1-acyl-sn-glycerol-3-phosphate acyltransferase [Paludibacteraceae bacterium]|nr:1-acyl-sn-glycerol-3-phosphate acyltransferase [Paludibacteraceae bacterium]